MWTTKQLKQEAKKILSKSYWKAFLVTLVILTVAGASSGLSTGISNLSSSVSKIAGKTTNKNAPKIILNTDGKEKTSDIFNGDKFSIRFDKGEIFVNDKKITTGSGDYSFNINGKKFEINEKDHSVTVGGKKIEFGDNGGVTVDGKKVDFSDVSGNVEINKDSVIVKDGDGKVVFDGNISKGKEAAQGALVVFFIIFAIVMSVVGIFVALIEIFVINPVVVGGKNYFNRQREGTGKFTNIFGGFTKGHYGATVRNMFLMGLYEFLWSLLFVIPGIIKGYSYWMVPYITAANPNLSAGRAFEISKKTMNGEKWHTFVLGLTFIGWDILASITVVGGYFLAPYKETTYAELYATLKQKAIDNGYATEEELAIAA